jgi:hypothetical protein
MKKLFLQMSFLVLMTGLLFAQCSKSSKASQGSTGNEEVVSQWTISTIGSSSLRTFEAKTEAASYRLSFENKSLCGSSATRVVVITAGKTLFEEVYQSGSDIKKTFSVPANSVLQVNTYTVEGNKNIVCVWQGTSSFTLTRL